MQTLDKIIADLKQARDEARLKAHLGSMDVQNELQKLEQRWQDFEAKAQLERSTKDVGAAFSLLASELKSAYDRITKAV